MGKNHLYSPFQQVAINHATMHRHLPPSLLLIESEPQAAAKAVTEAESEPEA